MSTSSPAPVSNVKLPIREKVAYGAGGLSDFFMANVLGGLAVPIFTLGFGMDPLLLSIGLAIPHVIAAIADVIVGSASDNIETRWGRRRPFILMGAIIGAICMPLVWWCPQGSNLVMFAYITVFSSLIAIGRSLFAVPYGALGMELTSNYDERTHVIAWKNLLGYIGTFCAAWFYWFTQREVWGGEIVGARVLSVIAAIIVVFASLMTVVFCKERQRHLAHHPRVPILKALKVTLGNSPFRKILSAQMLLAFGTGVVGVLGSYVHIMYACQGDKQLASAISGFGGSFTVGSGLVAIPLGLWLSKKLGKREAALCGLGILFCGLALLPFTLRPEHPYLVIITWVIDAVGMPCAAMIFGAMLPDICDVDELKTGLRREGAYSAVNSFVGRLVFILTMVASGWLPKLAGYVDSSVPPAGPMLEKMRYMLIGIQITVVIMAIIIVRTYPLSREKVREIQAEITKRKSTESESLAEQTVS